MKTKAIFSFFILLMLLMPISAFAAVNNSGSFNTATDRYGIIPYNTAQQPKNITTQISVYFTDWTKLGDTPKKMFSNTQVGGFNLMYTGKKPTSSTDAKPYSIMFHVHDGKKYLAVGVNVSTLSSGWNTFTSSYDGHTLKFYVNGMLKNTKKVSFNINYGVYKIPILIGAEPDAQGKPVSGEYLNGVVDDFRIYNYALTEEEVNHYWNRALTGNEKGLVGYYPMNGNLNDLTGKNNGDKNTLTSSTITKDLFESSPFPTPTPTPDPVIQPPKLTAEALIDGEVVRLSYTKTSESISLYNIYRDGKLLTTSTALSIRVDAEYDVLHSYTVTAVSAIGKESEMSNVVNISALKKKDTIPPTKPIGLNGNAYVGYVELKWKSNKESDLAGYYIYVNGVKYGDLITDSEIKIHGLAANKNYRFRVAAVDTSGNVSAKSDEITIKTKNPLNTKPPAAPKNLTAVLASNYLSVVLSWGAVNDSDLLGYYIYVSDDDLVYSQVNALAVNVTSYNFSVIEGNQTYYFKVAAVDNDGNVSEKTKSVSVKVPTRDPNESTNKKKELYVNWNEIMGATNYLVYYNGVLIATTDNQTFEFVIDAKYGYTGQPPANVEVKAKFEDGSIGYDKNLATQGKWGFSALDLWSSVKYVVLSVAGFLLLGIAVMFAPKAIRMIKEAVIKRSR